MPEIVVFTWADFEKSVDLITESIIREGIGKKVEAVIGIPRGGLPLAVCLSHLLAKPLIPLVPDLCLENMLVVDDISDNGDTLKKLNPRYSATIHSTPWTKFSPDIWIINKLPDTWIVYPWEVA